MGHVLLQSGQYLMVKSNMADVTTPYNLRRMLKGGNVAPHPTTQPPAYKTIFL